MLPIFFLLVFTLNGGTTQSDPISVEWLSAQTHDFGDLEKGKYAFHEFRFKNTGEIPVIISNVRPSCGCTAPNWKETPILPDSTASINIEFDARESGYFKKLIKVYFHGKRKGYKLYIEGFVEE